MKLQLALDCDEKKALKIAEKTKKYIDIIEIGTPLIKKSGLGVIKKFKKFRKLIIADLKTMDVGFLEAESAFKAGADISSVCACAGDATIIGAIKAGKKYKKKVLVDLIGTPENKLIRRTKQIIKLKPNYICIHTGIDQQKKGKKPLKNLKKISKLINQKNLKTKIAVAGGINLKNLGEITNYFPGIIIVGGAITSAKHPELIAEKIKERIK